jgi:hypothetical protein
MSKFKVRYSELNTSNLENLYSNLSIYNPYKSSVINITPAQITNLSSPLLLLPSPGANNYYMITSVSVSMNYNSIPYANAEGAENCGLFYGTTINNSAFPGSGIFQGITNNFSSISTNYSNSGLTGVATNQIVDFPIYLVAQNGLFLTSGNSPLKMTIFYEICSL